MKLYVFLEMFRTEGYEDQYIWIDQICIDQENVSERNHQVGLMAMIYSHCNIVFVWLSDQDEACAAAARDFASTRRLDPLVVLLRNEYFARLWIVQEILLAPAVWVFTSARMWIPWAAIQECVDSGENWDRFANLNLRPSCAKSLLNLQA